MCRDGFVYKHRLEQVRKGDIVVDEHELRELEREVTKFELHLELYVEQRDFYRSIRDDTLPDDSAHRLNAGEALLLMGFHRIAKSTHACEQCRRR